MSDWTPDEIKGIFLSRKVPSKTNSQLAGQSPTDNSEVRNKKRRRKRQVEQDTCSYDSAPSQTTESLKDFLSRLDATILKPANNLATPEQPLDAGDVVHVDHRDSGCLAEVRDQERCGAHIFDNGFIRVEVLQRYRRKN